MADGYAVRFKAVQRWVGPGMTKMTTTVKFIQYVRELPDGASWDCKNGVPLYFSGFLLPWSELNTARHRIFCFSAGGHTCAVRVVPDYPGAWKHFSRTEARV